MRILMAVSEFNRRGGFPRHAAQLAVALARRGHHIGVLTRNAEITDEDRDFDFHYYSIPVRPAVAALATEPMVVTRELRRIAGDYDVTVSVGIPVMEPVVLIGPATHRGYFKATVAATPRTSVRRYIEVLRPFHRVINAWERAMLRRRPPQLVVVGGGERYREEYTKAFSLPEDTVVSIPHGVEIDEFTFDPALRESFRAELGLAPDEPLLVNAAHRSWQKGLDRLIAALGLLPRDRAWRFAFAGDASLSRPIRRRTASLVREGRAQLLGRVPDIRALYCAADLLVFPSRYDGWGMVVTEAIATGTPAVSSSGIGAATAVQPGVNGFLVDDVNDARGIAGAIVRALDTPFEREAVAASVRPLTWDASAEGLEPHLARIATTNAPRPAPAPRRGAAEPEAAP